MTFVNFVKISVTVEYYRLESNLPIQVVNRAANYAERSLPNSLALKLNVVDNVILVSVPKPRLRRYGFNSSDFQ